MDALQAIQRAARENGIRDWRALAAVSHSESGLNPANIGDSGSSYGLFQLHRGGALGSMSDSQARKYLDAYQNASFAARKIRALGIHKLTGRDAIDAIVRQFEIPANPGAEVQRAWAWYTQNQGKGLGATTLPQPNVPAPSLGSSDPTQGSGGQSTQFAQNLIDSNAKMFHLPTIHLPAFAPTQLGISAKPDGITPQQMPHPSSIGNAIVNAAKNFLGVPYVWGGTTPKGFDCSGLVKYVFHKFGITTPRVSEEQFKGGMKVSQQQARAGDLVFFRHSDGDVGHVGIYLGNGQMINAPHTGDVVRIASISGRNIAGFRRYAR